MYQDKNACPKINQKILPIHCNRGKCSLIWPEVSNQQTNQTTKQSTNQSTTRTDQSTHQPTNQPTNQLSGQ